MIKIAFVIDTIESPTAGTEKQLLMLIRHLDRARFRPYLCVLRGSAWLSGEFRDCELVEVDLRSFGHPRALGSLWRFARFLRRERIDIVQTYFVDSNKAGILAGALAGVGSIVSNRRNQGYWHTRSELLMLGVLNRRVDRFLANSEDTRQWAARTEGIDPGKITVIYNSLETERYFRGSPAQRAAFRESLQFPPGAPVAGLVGNLRPVKAIDTFVKAAELVCRECPEARFVVVGEGDERGALERLTRELGMSSRIRFLGRRQDIPEILGCLDLGVLSSSSESFSNAIVEYLAAGLPVVCTAVGGAAEAVEEGVNGHLVPPGDHQAMARRICGVLGSEQRAQWGERSRQKALELFSAPNIVDKYQRFFSEVARG